MSGMRFRNSSENLSISGRIIVDAVASQFNSSNLSSNKPVAMMVDIIKTMKTPIQN
jgi:hypothetical protein